jgi:RNA polymerase sigma-70 factor (ECF subfamily)
MEPGEENDRLRESQQGSTVAFGRIVRSYQRAVHRVAYALTRNAGDADDVTQETFLRAWQAIGRFRVGEPLYPWLAAHRDERGVLADAASQAAARGRARAAGRVRRAVGGPDDPAENVAAASGTSGCARRTTRSPRSIARCSRCGWSRTSRTTRSRERSRFRWAP